MIFDLLLSAIWGVLLHQVRPHTELLPAGWRDLTNDAIGIAGSAPVFLVWHIRLKDVKNNHNRALLAFVLSFLGIGTGVALGWMLDTWRSTQ